MELTFQVPMQCCSLQYWILLSSPGTSTTERCFHLWHRRFILSGAISSSPLLFPSSILDSFKPGDSSFGVISFCSFIQFMRISRQVHWGDLPFPPPADRVLSELSSMTHPFGLALHSMAHSFIELCKPLLHNKAVVKITKAWGYLA